MRRANCIHWSVPFYIGDLSILGFGCPHRGPGTNPPRIPGTTKFWESQTYRFDRAGSVSLILTLFKSQLNTILPGNCPVQIKQGIGTGSESQLCYLVALWLWVALSLPRFFFHKMRLPFCTSLDFWKLNAVINAKLNKYFCAPSTWPSTFSNSSIYSEHGHYLYATVSYIFRNKVMLVSFLKDGGGALAFNL